MIDIEKYISQTKYVPGLKVDVAFQISDSFYYGPENNWSEDDRKNKIEVLEKPSLPLFFEQYALSEDFLGHENQLVTYYQSVLKASKKYNKNRKAGDSYFWLRPIVYQKGLDYIGFPWYDTFVEGLPFLEALVNNNSGLIFNDLEQGWQVAVYAENDKFHFIQTNWEDDELLWAVNGNREIISMRARKTIERTKNQIEYFASNLGTDFWTRYNR